VGAEHVAAVNTGAVDTAAGDRTGDQDAGENDDVGDELGRLERRLGLGRQTTTMIGGVATVRGFGRAVGDVAIKAAPPEGE
jgi:hypothetical protein